MQFQELSEKIKAYHPNPDLVLLEKAYNFAFKAHETQVRASGEPYFLHVFETALLACELKLDTDSVAAALLHDVIEDCSICEEELLKEFNPEISLIVQGVSKLTNIRFDSKEAKQAENFRKMLIAMAQDVRVVLVKLCDRLHNMRTIGHLPEVKRQRIALETQEIYAPIANRLGLYPVKSELEDLCLLHLRPEIYHQIDQSFEQSKTDRTNLINKTSETIKNVLAESGVSGKIYGRSKHYYSIWQKMERQGISFEEIHDLLAFRVIVPTLRSCYETLGIVHSAWKPVPGLFKDYIAMPKPNMYQSLHTTVVGLEGQRIEIQIRTPDMHRVAEEGVAAHWRYKEGENSKGFDLKWITDLVDTQAYLNSPDEFIQSVKAELFPDDIFVFTPNGDLIRLPFESCPIDFAYYVHTDIGNTTTGAKVNGQMVQLSHQLNNGDTVEIITNRNQNPRRDWLNFTKSSKARQKVRSFLKSSERARSLAFGTDLVMKELKTIGQNFKKLEKANKFTQVANAFGFQHQSDLFAEIGYGKIKVKDVLLKIFPHSEVTEKIHTEAEEEVTPLQRIFRKAATSKNSAPVKIAGMDQVLVRYARCCEPLSGDRIIGFITRGRGVSIHRKDCTQIMNCDPQRLIPVQWETDVEEQRKVRITLIASDRTGLLAAVSTAVSNCGVSILYSDTTVQQETRKALINFEIMVNNSEHLNKIRRAIEMVPGVIKVERVISKSGEASL